MISKSGLGLITRKLNEKGYRVIFLFGLFALLILLLFYILPIITMLLSILMDYEKLTSDILFIFSDPRPINAFWFSLWQAIISTLISLFFGLPVAYIFSHYRFIGKKVMKSVLTIPFLLPPIVVVQGFITIYAENGLINTIIKNFLSFLPTFDLYSIDGIIFVHVFYNSPIIIRMVSVVWENLDNRPLEVAKTLGASRFTLFRKLELPQLKYVIFSSSLLVFLYCFTSLAVVLSFGGLQVRTLEVQIFRFANSLPYFDFALASTLAFIQLIFLIMFIIMYYFLTKKDTRQKKIAYKTKKQFNLTRKRDFSLILYLILYSIIMTLPMLGIFFYSFIDRLGNYTFNNFLMLFSNVYDATIQTSLIRLVVNTLFIAFLTILFSLVMALGIILLIRYWRPIELWNRNHKTQDWFHLILLLPLASSGLLIALGLYSIFKSTILYREFDIIVIIMAHSIAALPITSRILNSGFNKLNKDSGQIGATLKANKLEILLKIEIPLMIKPLLIAALFSFAISLGEFGATLFINPQEFTTLGIAIYRLLGTQNLGLSSAMASILMFLCFLAFFIIDQISEEESIF
jgi:thiamine transport system permease protein